MEFSTEMEMLEFVEQHAYAAIFSDVMDELGYRHQVVSPGAGIRPLAKRWATFGRAVTLLNALDCNDDEPYELVIKCIDAIPTGTVLVTTGEQAFDAGIMGELTATALRARGCRGAIVNGYTRDVRKLIEMDYPTFAWGGSPVDTTGRVRVVEYNIPITFGGLTIQPQTLVYADLDGIVVIPHELEQDVLKMAIERIHEESLVRKELAEGKRMADVWSKYGIL